MSDSSEDIDLEVAVLVAEAADDFRARLACGETPDPQLYIDQYPAAADSIRGVLAALQLAVAPQPERSTDGCDQTVDHTSNTGDLSTAQAHLWSLPTPGSFFGGFDILEELGRGGMGAVFRATDPTLRREVALKIMLPEVASRRGTTDRFLREARALAALNHDHVVPVYQVGEERESPFLVMPLLEGETLQARLRREKALASSEVVRIGRETASGLEALHSKGLIHRDIKPANLWLESPGGRVKLLDFGLARETLSTHLITRSSDIVGTPAYMSPEQINGESLDFPSDLFSLGSVLYEAATGELPFAGTTLTSVLMAIGEKEPRPANMANSAVSQELSDFIRVLHSKRPGERPQSASEVVDTLRRMEGRIDRSPRSKAHRSKRRAGWSIVAAALCAGAIALIAWQLSSPVSTPRSEPEATPDAEIDGKSTSANAERVRIRDFEVHHRRTEADQSVEIGVFGKHSFGAVFGEAIRVRAKLTRPAYSYIVVFRPDGKDEVIYPEDDAVVPEKNDEPSYPSKRRDNHYELTEGVGVWLVTIIASDRPLPSYRDWRAMHAGGPWKQFPGKLNVVWIDDGKWLDELSENQNAVRGDRGKKEVADRIPIVGTVDWLKMSFRDAAVSGIGFTVIERTK